MGKKYLVVEVEEKNDGDDSWIIGLLLLLAFVAFPPLIIILSCVRGSCFDDDNGFVWGTSIASLVIGFLWSACLIILPAVEISYGSSDFVGKEWLISLAVTYFVMHLAGLITAAVTMNVSLGATAKKILIFLACAAFAAGILATILLGVL